MLPTPRADASPWWRTAVVYEIYPRSFADANGDGEGDLAGIISRLPYLQDLGVDAIWIAPWYPSPMADGGYDVSDYCDIHPRFGNLNDADELLTRAHQLGLRVIIDLVANHTSREHPWFRAALEAEPASQERERYVFRDGRGPGGNEPPNNWISAFGDSAWTRLVKRDGRPGQWYLHTFAPEQPDLNWANEAVRLEFDEILRFWLDRGVDGFRVDAAPAMGKDPNLPDAVYSADLRFASADWVDNPHWDVDSVHSVMRRWRAITDTYPGDRVFVAEASVNGPERLARYLRADELHSAFNFDYMHSSWEPDEFRNVIQDTMRGLEPVGAPATWAMSSHDEIRHLTRFGSDGTWGPKGFDTGGRTDLQLGTRRARAAILLTLALPGGAYIYQGEELGLPEAEDLPTSMLQDPVFFRSGGASRGRDGCRVPVPWRGDAPPFGFSETDVASWLPQPAEWRHLTVAAQTESPDSMLTLYRSALHLRRQLVDLKDGNLTWMPSPSGVLRFRRGTQFQCIVNMSDAPFLLDGAPVIASLEMGDRHELEPDGAAWLLSD